MTGAWLLAYADQILAPKLRPGDIVIPDNLRALVGHTATESKGPPPV